MGEGVEPSGAGVRTWFDELGEDDPIVLLRGRAVDALFFDEIIGTTVVRFQVSAVDAHGHGRAPDVEGRITDTLVGHDMTAFRDAAVDGLAHLVGHSVGANIVMHEPIAGSSRTRSDSQQSRADTTPRWPRSALASGRRRCGDHAPRVCLTAWCARSRRRGTAPGSASACCCRTPVRSRQRPGSGFPRYRPAGGWPECPSRLR